MALVAVVAGGVAREVWGVLLHPGMDYVYSDMAGYVDRARRLVDAEPLSRFDTIFAPGTHLLLAAPLEVFGTGRSGLLVASVLWSVLSLLAPLLAWRIARRWFSPAAAALTAVLMAASPLAVTYSGFFTSETPSTTALLAVVLAALAARDADGRRRIALGLLFGLAGGALAIVRPQLALNAALATLPLLIDWRRHWVTLVAAVAAGAAVVVPVLALNASAGSPGRISTYDGMNFYLGHCDVHELTLGLPASGRWDVSSPVAIQRHRGFDHFVPDHLPWDSGFFFDAGLDCIRADGVGHVTDVARNVADLTATSVPWPQADGGVLRAVARLSNLVYCVALGLGLLVVSVLLRRGALDRRRSHLLVVAHLALLLPTAVLFLGEPRFRVPYDAFGLMLIAALIARWARLDERPAAR